MNYDHIYSQLIKKGKNRNLEGYKETHHILPKCLGGSNHKDNLVDLTAKEHYIAHLLLTRIYPDKKGIWFAFKAICNFTNKKSGRLYEESRLKSNLFFKGVPLKENHRKKIGDSNRGKIRTEEFKTNLSNIIKKKIKNGEFIPNTSGLRPHKKGEFKHSENTKRKLSEHRIGKSYEDLMSKEKVLKRKNELSKNWKGDKNPMYVEYDFKLAESLILEGKTNSEIIDIIGVSLPTFINKFKKKYGLTPKKWKNEVLKNQ